MSNIFILKKALLFLVLHVFCFQGFAQSNKKAAWEHIEELKNGVLLVRLQTSKKKIDLLKQNSDLEKAEAVKKKQESENKSIMAAFNDYFDFCNVYFFYSENSKSIRQGDFAHLFDGQKKPVKNLGSDKVYYVSYTYVVFDTEFNSSNNKYMVIMDKDFKQLKKPFPYYLSARQFDYSPDLNSYLKEKEMNRFDIEIYTLNQRLLNYFEKVKRKIKRRRLRKGVLD